MSENSDRTNLLEGFISTAEYVIANYLKEHVNCPEEELYLHVLNSINLKRNRRNDTVHDTKPIHTLAFLIAFKELEKEGIIQVDRKDLEFPLIDARSRFSLKP